MWDKSTACTAVPVFPILAMKSPFRNYSTCRFRFVRPTKQKSKHFSTINHRATKVQRLGNSLLRNRKKLFFIFKT